MAYEAIIYRARMACITCMVLAPILDSFFMLSYACLWLLYIERS